VATSVVFSLARSSIGVAESVTAQVRISFEAMLTYGLQQGLVPRRMPLDEEFVSTRA
jgi:hypothetical protein